MSDYWVNQLFEARNRKIEPKPYLIFGFDKQRKVFHSPQKTPNSTLCIIDFCPCNDDKVRQP